MWPPGSQLLPQALCLLLQGLQGPQSERQWLVWCQPGTAEGLGNSMCTWRKFPPLHCLAAWGSQAHPAPPELQTPGLLPGVAVSPPGRGTQEERSASSLSKPSKPCEQKRFQSPVLMGFSFSWLFLEGYCMCVLGLHVGMRIPGDS